MRKEYSLLLGVGIVVGLVLKIAHSSVEETPMSAQSEEIQEISHAEEAVSPVALEPEKKHSPIQKKEFLTLTHSVRRSLPTTHDLQNLKDVHHTPQALIHAGSSLGDVAQALHDNPALAPEASLFYKECATHGDYPTSVRALCFSHLKELSSAQGNEVLENGLVSEDVRLLSERL